MKRNHRIQTKIRQRDREEPPSPSKKNINVMLNFAQDRMDLKDLCNSIQKLSILKFIKEIHRTYQIQMSNTVTVLFDFRHPIFINQLLFKSKSLFILIRRAYIPLNCDLQIIINMQQEKNHNKHVKWDEQKLKQTQKTRGTFQKINEPKTPYRQNSDSEGQQIQAQPKSQQEIALQQSLHKAKVNCNINGHKKFNIAELNAKLKEELESYHKGEEMMDEEQEERERRKEEFKKKRNQHYNQFKLIQEMKNQRWEEDEEDD